MSESQPPINSRQSLDVPAALTGIPFVDRESAQHNFSRMAERLSPSLGGALPTLLAESPDPDSALILFERLIDEPTGEIVRLLNQHNFLAHYAIVVFGHSRFLGETLIQNNDSLQSFLRGRNLDRSFSREEFHEALARFRSRSFERDVSLLLARFKRREYVRIMLRDVLKIAPLAETTAEISALADVLIEDALRESENRLQRRYGAPQRLDAEGRAVHTPFAVLSLGKLGGSELNYSSDVDLMYVFGDGEAPADAAISNREYFIRLAQHVTEVLSSITREGPVFRIDMRLRPQGAEGELAISLDHALRYYSETAHDWERQALIKVRYSAGDEALAAGDESLAREFIRKVQPYVYTTQVNFPAIETALQAREKMHIRRRRLGALQAEQSIDVKLDRGGIRDIEFLVQCLQRVYGGAEPWLRSGGTLFPTNFCVTWSTACNCARACRLTNCLHPRPSFAFWTDPWKAMRAAKTAWRMSQSQSAVAWRQSPGFTTASSITSRFAGRTSPRILNSSCVAHLNQVPPSIPTITSSSAWPTIHPNSMKLPAVAI